MRYLGGKAKQAKWISREILQFKGNRQIYLEPFVGGGSVLSLVASSFPFAVASDIVPDLILLWQEVCKGWIPPNELTKEEYTSLISSSPSPLRGWAAFAASYGGKYFGGYHTKLGGRNWLAESQRGILKKAENLNHVVFECCSYDSHTPDSSYVVYCDPPYKNTESYKGAGAFDHDRFWSTMDRWSESGAIVLVSEYEAPSHWRKIASGARFATLAAKDGRQVKQDSLFIRK